MEKIAMQLFILFALMGMIGFNAVLVDKLFVLFKKRNNMKNIHILPTDKPSRLHNKNGELGNYPSTKLYIEDFKGNQYNSFHIYITSDEEIKEGYWVIYNNKVSKIERGDNELFHLSKKIILTTDQDLIKDNIQDINDDFLEWFVKNPSCDEIKIEPIPNSNWGFDLEEPMNLGYKIITPKEEPKQFSMDENLYENNDIVLPELPKQETLEEEKLIHSLFVSETEEELLREFEGESDEEIKQETLEEVLGSSMCQYSVIENKLAILYRNQIKIYNVVTKKQQEITLEDMKKQSWKYDPRKKLDIEFIRAAFVAGSLWYKEQLEKNGRSI